MVEASPHRVHLQRSLVEFPREIDGQDEERCVVYEEGLSHDGAE